jgi:hypothetical protein
MPVSKRNKKNKKGGGDGDINKQVSTINNFTSSRSISPVNVSERPESLKPKSSLSASIFSPTNKSRLLTVPASAVATAASAATAVSSAVKPSGSGGWLVIRYLLIIIILAFLVLTLYLYLEKPETTSIINLYDPVFKFFDNLDRKTDSSGIKQLEKTIDDKKVVNNIDGTGAASGSVADTDKKRYKKKPVIPEADDSLSQTQMKPKSKKGFCYIGEDRGFRSCIEVGEGDVCMSGDIFPTQAICINPNLRE